VLRWLLFFSHQGLCPNFITKKQRNYSFTRTPVVTVLVWEPCVVSWIDACTFYGPIREWGEPNIVSCVNLLCPYQPIVHAPSLVIAVLAEFC
jgi:hypothetical protein